ncbi:MAG TPA: tRNA dihydrouridine(20/20a) synthase DusA, partial [Leptospiraceae bacterium]|nr:tRNA dihydrouridine(20/20a) synthase DusA [Leptospiraceae bacterium]
MRPEDFPSYRLSVAPMMSYTDRHFRYILRKLTKYTLLYTEMIPMDTVLRGDRKRFLEFSLEEKPLSIQFGGNDPDKLADCAAIAEDFGYDEVNLNVGCPSDRVQNGNFGACLMLKPELVAGILKKMKSRTRLPVTVKHRIGVNGKETYEDMKEFVSIVSASGCDRFIIHARIAVLGGLSTKENRTIPPLRYQDVYRLKEEFPHLKIEINGGIKDWANAAEHLKKTDGVMIGRSAYEDTYLFASADQKIFNSRENILSRKQLLYSIVPYMENMM